MGTKHKKRRKIARARSPRGSADCGRRANSATLPWRKNRNAGNKVKGKESGPSLPRSLSARRLWLFRLAAAVLAPLVLLLTLESTLRLIGYGYPVAAMLPCEIEAQQAYCDNIHFGRRFFPRRLARELVPFSFPATKAKDSYRIFVLGASAVKGEPDNAYNFSRQLKTMLKEQYAHTNFEVTTVAMVAINSHVLVEMARDCAGHDPDLMILYLGNNEVVGPYGPGTVFTPLARYLPLLRASVVCKALRVGQLFTQVLERVSVEQRGPSSWQGLEMFLENHVSATDPRLQRVYRHFEVNLEKIIRIATRSGSQLMLCTVASNLKDCPPFASRHGADLGDAEKAQWKRIYQEGISQEAAGHHGEAVTSYLAAAELDDRFADLQFRLARCYATLDQQDEARRRYTLARDLDTLRLRADTHINAIIRDLAAKHAQRGVLLADVVETFADNSVNRIPGEELFYEHVHMTFTGNHQLAQTLAGTIAPNLPEGISLQGDERPWLSEAECARQLTYTNWARYNNLYKILNFYLRKPPFTNQLYQGERIPRIEARLAGLKAQLTPEAFQANAAQYRQRLQEEPGDVWLRWRYAQLLSAHLNDENAATEQCRLAQKQLPCSYRSHLLLALSLERQGRWRDAIKQFKRVLELKPGSAEAHYHLGLAYEATLQAEEAIRHFAQAIRLQPTLREAYLKSIVLLSGQNQIEQAIKLLRRATQALPNDPVLHFNLGILLHRQQRPREATQELRTAQRLDPNSPEIRKALDSMSR
jgi:tetratricopeptide (TPR) repeat protein